MTSYQWIRLHRDMLDDPRVGRLSDGAFRLYINLSLLAGRQEDRDGRLPELADIAWALRQDEETVTEYWTELERVGLVYRNTPKAKEMGGYVYLAHSETGQYKIGRSKSPPERIRVFDTRMPISVTLIHLIRCDDDRRAERQLHYSFSHRHHVGEWFNLDDDDVASIKLLKGFSNGAFTG